MPKVGAGFMPPLGAGFSPVRDAKYAHLSTFENASDKLRLFRPDLLDYSSIHSAVEGCIGVFHVASPVPSTTVELIEPAVKGTLNVLKASLEAKVKRVVVVSSGAAVSMNPSWPKDQVMDETSWSDKEYCRTTQNWYCLSKTEAESQALEFAKGNGLDVVTVCPTLVFGPILQPTVNASSLIVIKLLKEGLESVENKHRTIVDVRDVAEALILVYEKPEAEGRYICTAHTTTAKGMVDMLKSIYPHYNYPKNFIEVQEEGGRLSSEKLQRLGCSYRPLKETLIGSVESYLGSPSESWKLSGMAAQKGSVCVTGAGGFVASWLIKLLLSKNYSVHATARQPGRDAKYAHLSTFENASDKLRLFKADLLDCSSIHSAVEGCIGVFHVASPVPSTTVPNPEVELIEPAVKGTLNVLKASLEAKVKRVVVVSSVAAVSMNPSWPKDQVMDETSWSDKEYCRTTQNWYCLSKTEAESQALEFAKGNGLDVVTVCPTLVFGPILQPTVNASSLIVIKLLKEGLESVENKHRTIVDVRDVAEALILVYEKPEAEGRYICTAHTTTAKGMVDMLKSIYPHYNYPKNFIEVQEEGGRLSSEKLQRLGFSYRPLKETLIGSVESYREAGLLD
ncbi:hypothetical protein FH972_014140 [Carpinus fangiana]|uniref:NAD-dependent epimerase/dehydratase domain-containing protein n=1 Tax=Carpinus fangiana TaxID=176857 RepID=A0A5N6RCC6_9ROSI|nr:hypothetical protein FH972_014140 [Carpinus fangiana]